jgi:hypothetical protein
MRFIRNYRGYIIVVFLTNDGWFDARFKKLNTNSNWKYAKTSFRCVKTEVELIQESINELEFNTTNCWHDERKKSKLVRRDGKIRYNS